MKFTDHVILYGTCFVFFLQLLVPTVPSYLWVRLLGLEVRLLAVHVPLDRRDSAPSFAARLGWRPVASAASRL